MENVQDVLLTHRGKLLGFLQKRLADPDLAEDVLQEGLIKALRSADELRDDERLIPWFYSILNHAVIDTYRRRDVEKRYLQEYASDMAMENNLSEASPEDEAALCECFREVLPALKPEYAELIERLELQHGDPGEYARQMNIQPNNLKVRRHRARQALKQRLEETCRTCAVHGCLDCTCRSGAAA